MGELGSERQARRARTVFLAIWAVTLLVRGALAVHLDLFGDEAYYAWQSARLAPAFSDLPPGTAALAAAGRSLEPGSVLALRTPFLLLASLLPWLVVRWARAFCDEQGAWHAGSAAMLLPLFLPVGTLALPEAALALLSPILALALTGVLARGSPRDWLALSLILALGLQVHHRFLIAAAGVGAALLLHRAGRVALRTPWPWLTGFIAAASLAPAWMLEREVLGASLAFQFAERHPWRFAIDGLLHLPLQALVSTPLLWILAWVGVIVHRRHLACTPAGAALAGVGVFPMVLFASLAPFADQARTSLHWPFAAFLVLLPLAFADWPKRPRILRVATFALLSLGSLLAAAYLAAAALPRLAAGLAEHKAFPEGFVGWRELRSAVADHLSRESFRALLADNVLLGAQLAFASPTLPLFVLDHPRNAFHGRAVQLARWAVDERAFAAAGAFPALLVVEDEATPLRARLLHYRTLCQRAEVVHWEGELSLYNGRRRFLFFRLDRGRPDCRLPPIGYLDRVAFFADPPRRLLVEGWAVKEFSGVIEVGVLLDGLERARAAVALPAPKVIAQWPFSADPRHPQVGFRVVVDLQPDAPRPRRIGLRLYGADGSVRDHPERALD